MRGSGGARWQLGGGGRGEAASCLRQVRFSSLLEFNLYLRMPPPDAETLELRSQLEGLVGKLKAKQEEVASSLNKRKSDSRFPFCFCQVRDDAGLGTPGSK